MLIIYIKQAYWTVKEFALNKEERKEDEKEKETKWNNKCFFIYYQGNGLNIIGLLEEGR